jgi:hypothetical protein
MAKAADRALAVGDLLTANAYLDAAAALLEAHTDKRMTAEEFARPLMGISRASNLANSPHLPQAVRGGLQRRIGPDRGHFAG